MFHHWMLWLMGLTVAAIGSNIQWSEDGGFSMATPGELVKRVATVLGVPEVTIGSYYRNLRESGYMTKGGRGSSAAKMTTADAAHLLAAVGGARFEKEAASKIVEEFKQLRVSHTSRCMAVPTGERPGWLDGEWLQDESGRWAVEGFSMPSLQSLKEGQGFIEALTGILDAGMNREFSEAQHADYPDLPVFHTIDIAFYGPQPHAGIEINLSNAAFSYSEHGSYHLQASTSDGMFHQPEIEEQERRGYGVGDLEIVRRITFKTIYGIVDLLRKPDDGR